MLTPAVTAVVWKRIYAPNGPINSVLHDIGLGGLARGWLGDYTWALPALGLAGTWAAFGLCMVLFVSGMQAIPTELYDASRVDGAGAVREFFTVTLPGLRGTLSVVLTLTVLGAMRVFDIVWLTTRGGPGHLHHHPDDRALRAGVRQSRHRLPRRRSASSCRGAP